MKIKELNDYNEDIDVLKASGNITSIISEIYEIDANDEYTDQERLSLIIQEVAKISQENSELANRYSAALLEANYGERYGKLSHV